MWILIVTTLLFIFALLGCIVNAVLGLDLTLSENSALAQRIIGAVISVSMIITLVTLCSFSNHLIYHLRLARGVHIDDFDDFDDFYDFVDFVDFEEEREDSPPPLTLRLLWPPPSLKPAKVLHGTGGAKGAPAGPVGPPAFAGGLCLAIWTEEEIQVFADITVFEIAQHQLREDNGKANVLNRLAAKDQ
ncbi:unnamed protein product [Parascedosporium putredinis]|uniref:Uncharacterized protein n=1 Tax=Parascedosporium putredinis TaxID=1442378 RepID=A0A9P1GY75_9PEZI|nr:unnamed protein product [Parascedosporium putredinis]CAI7991402.1 unnamed protein product [Parascedosporium putredinis]